jgi:hypothetical protein
MFIHDDIFFCFEANPNMLSYYEREDATKETDK